MRRWGWVAGLAVAGCAVTVEEFPGRQQRGLCDRLFECGSEADIASFASIEACYADVPASAGTCAFDAEAARDCLAQIDAGTCADVLGAAFPPEVCGVVCL
jgi:hypothetical protein